MESIICPVTVPESPSANIDISFGTFDPRASASRIDIRYGGDAGTVERESVMVAEAYVTTVFPGRSVLYLNSLVPFDRFSTTIFYARERLRSKVQRDHLHYIDLHSDDLWRKRAFLQRFIEEHRVRVIVVNSFEFLSLHACGRNRALAFLKRLRDEYCVQIVVYMQKSPALRGAQGLLRWIAESMTSMRVARLTKIAFKPRIALTPNPSPAGRGAFKDASFLKLGADWRDAFRSSSQIPASDWTWTFREGLTHNPFPSIGESVYSGDLQPFVGA